MVLSGQRSNGRHKKWGGSSRPCRPASDGPAKCQSLDHSSANCPTYRLKKRQWSMALGAGSYQQPGREGRASQEICFKLNKYNGDCKFGKDCRHLHICSNCREPAPNFPLQSHHWGRWHFWPLNLPHSLSSIATELIFCMSTYFMITWYKTYSHGKGLAQSMCS